MTTINTIEDLVRLLRDNPDWAEAVRQTLLTRELLDMPATLHSLLEVTSQTAANTNALTGLAERMLELQATSRESLDGIANTLVRVERGQEDIHSQNTRLEGRLGNFSGREYETWVGAQLHDLLWFAYGMQRAETLHQPGPEGRDSDLSRMISNRIADSALDRAQAGDLRALDFLVTGIIGDQVTYVAIEASITGEKSDAIRANRRAAAIHRLFSQTCLATVVAETLEPALIECLDDPGTEFPSIEPTKFNRLPSSGQQSQLLTNSVKVIFHNQRDTRV